MKGSEIREAREARGWTQLQLAQALGVSVRTISNWELSLTGPKNRAGMIRKVLGPESVSADPDTDAIEDGSDIRYRRPEGVSDQQWAQIRARGQAYIEGLIDGAAQER